MRLRRAFELSLALAFSLVFATNEAAAVPRALSFTLPQQGVSSSSAFVNPRDYGAIADCRSHPLSTMYSSLDAARAVYPFITSLAQEIDYAAVKQASNVALGADTVIGSYITMAGPSTTTVIADTTANYPVNSLVGQILYLRYPNAFIDSRIILSNTATTITIQPGLADFHNGTNNVCGFRQAFDCSAYAVGSGEHGYNNAKLNKPIYLPAGTYVFGDDTWLIRNVSGARITGDGRTATILTSNVTVFATDGLWYSIIEGVEFRKLTNAAVPAVDIDGNVPGHPYATRSVQGNSFRNCLFDGGGGNYAFALNRQGGSSAQGENLYEECHFKSADVAYYQWGFNALQNLFIRGDMQDFTTGIRILAGSVRVISTSMESGRGYTQITNGWDIDASTSGVGEPIIVEGVRSEGLKFFHGSSAQTGVLIGNQTTCGYCTQRSANGNYTLNQLIVTNGLWRVSTAGTTGGAQPTWTISASPITDGTVVWTYTPFNVVDAGTGNAWLIANNFPVGGTVIHSAVNTPLVYTSADYTFSGDRYASASPITLLVDTTGGNRTVELANGTPPPDGQVVTVKKITADANTITLTSGYGNGLEAATVIPGGSTGYVTLQYSQSAGISSKWWIINKSF